jgi:hypothetical protein
MSTPANKRGRTAHPSVNFRRPILNFQDPGNKPRHGDLPVRPVTPGPRRLEAFMNRAGRSARSWRPSKRSSTSSAPWPPRIPISRPHRRRDQPPRTHRGARRLDRRRQNPRRRRESRPGKTSGPQTRRREPQRAQAAAPRPHPAADRSQDPEHAHPDAHAHGSEPQGHRRRPRRHPGALVEAAAAQARSGRPHQGGPRARQSPQGGRSPHGLRSTPPGVDRSRDLRVWERAGDRATCRHHTRCCL